jgi:hypothetical protein
MGTKQECSVHQDVYVAVHKQNMSLLRDKHQERGQLYLRLYTAVEKITVPKLL